MKRKLWISICYTLFLPCIGKVSGEDRFRLSTFQADVTPPVGHMLFTGQFKTATGIQTDLKAKGLVLQIAGDKPIVICAVDWSEIRNETYDQWRDRLAAAAGTVRERVLVSAIHQHDTPMGDLGAERILRSLGSPHQVIDPEFHEQALTRVVKSLTDSLKKVKPVTHISFGNGKVEKVASNRRYIATDGTPKFNRGSSCKILAAQLAPEGEIDPFLKSISFWNGEKELAVYSVYATHPMSYYGTRRVDSDFPGLARKRRQSDTPDALQIYASGCSGNVTVGKYNDGSRENRAVFADRLYQGMVKASETATRSDLTSVSFSNEKLTVMPRKTRGFTKDELLKRIENTEDARSHLMSSLGLSWLERIERAGSVIDVPSILFNGGEAQIVLLPGEIYVDYQNYAQSLAPKRFVMTPGYGESAPGYIPLEQHWKEKDNNLHDWCWVAEGMEKPIKAVLQKLVFP